MGKYDAELERLFRKQFRTEHGRFVFRRNSKGRPLPVTKQEAEAAVALFLKRNRIATILVIGAGLLAAIAIALIDNGSLAEAFGIHWLLVVPLIVAVLIGLRWSWLSPIAHFERRVPVGSERSRQDVRAEMLADWGWARVLGFVALGFVLTVPHVIYWPPQTWDQWLWFGLGGFLVIAGGINCFEKWRLERSRH